MQVTLADILDGPTIAINGAICHHAIVFTHWCGLDEPDRFIPAENLKPWGENPEPTVITKDSNAPKWRARWPDLKYDLYTEPRKNMGAMLPWKKTLVNWLHWSVLGALHYAVIHGAKRIRLLGADMAGDGYAYSAQKIGKGKKNADVRWSEERRHINEAFNEIRAGGIDVERVSPGMVSK